MSDSYISIQGKTPHQKSDRIKEWDIFGWGGRSNRRNEMVKQTSCFQLTKTQSLERYKCIRNSTLILLWKSAKLKAKALFIPAFSVSFYFERESVCTWGGRGREREEEKESQASSVLSAWSLTWDSIPQTVKSWPEPKLRVLCLTDWATKAPLYSCFLTEYRMDSGILRTVECTNMILPL